MVTEMRSFHLLTLAPAFLFALLNAQTPPPGPGLGPGPPFDTRPFGKYLERICSVSGICNNPNIPAQIPPNSAAKPPQTITIKQVGCAAGVTPCPDPVYPLSVGDYFFVSAIADSGLQVDQQVISGNVTQDPGTATRRYRVNEPGTVVIRAALSADASASGAVAAPVELSFTVGANAAANASQSCSVLLPPTPNSLQVQLKPQDFINLIGSPTPFVLAAQGDSSILVYSTRSPLRPNENQILDQIVAQMGTLAGQPATSLGIAAAPTPFTLELAVPHAAALGDLAARIGGLNYSQFTVQDIGSDRVRITAAKPPDCDTWTAFLTSIRHMEWQVTPEPFDLKLYYLSSTDAAAAFSSLGAGSAAPAASAGNPPATSSTPPASTSNPSATGTAGNATIAVSQPPGSVIEVKSNTTPCVVAGLELSNSSACAPASGTGASPSASGSSGSTPVTATSAGSAAAAKPIGMASMGVAAGSAEQTFADLLVFSDSNPGDDSAIVERKRILAQLDLPRPEVVINAWVMQNSTENPRAIGRFSSRIKDMVAEYNDALECVVLLGWKYVSQQTLSPSFFNKSFYHYIADRYVEDTSAKSNPTDSQTASKPSVQSISQSFLNTSQASLADTAEKRNNLGICAASQYCLGYTALFAPLKPRLTDLLLTLIAADDPVGATEKSIAAVQGPISAVASEHDCATPMVPGEDPRELRERCRAIWKNLGMSSYPVNPSSCTTRDYREILGSLITRPGSDKHRRPRVYLACFEESTTRYFSNIGLMRAAVADFLFNYKISQQYPHEFVPYDLSQSADSLNAALSLVIDAFNRDIVAYQTFMRADLQYQVERLNSENDERCCVKRLFGLDKPSFFNDGLITVRTISGQATQVITTSQSALDASAAPTISNLLNNIATPASGSANSISPVASVLGSSQAPASLLAGALNSYQNANVQIGRNLNLTVTPRTLSTASSAELNVTLSADESASGPLFTGGPLGGAAQNTSRVASHDVTSRIRVESVKLFELSSFSAIVERSHSRFPLLPPFIEIPYIGTLAGIPIPAAKEYHSSTAVISAMIVPTSADIAYGLKFRLDLLIDGDAGSCSFLPGSAGPGVTRSCSFRRAVSTRDFPDSPIRSFHRAMISCFASGMKSPYSSAASLITPPVGACESLSFQLVPRDAM